MKNNNILKNLTNADTFINVVLKALVAIFAIKMLSKFLKPILENFGLKKTDMEREFDMLNGMTKIVSQEPDVFRDIAGNVMTSIRIRNDAVSLYNAMYSIGIFGLGTNEVTIQNVLKNYNKKSFSLLNLAYSQKYEGRHLQTDLSNDLSDKEMAKYSHLFS